VVQNKGGQVDVAWVKRGTIERSVIVIVIDIGHDSDQIGRAPVSSSALSCGVMVIVIVIVIMILIKL